MDGGYQGRALLDERFRLREDAEPSDYFGFPLVEVQRIQKVFSVVVPVPSVLPRGQRALAIQIQRPLIRVS